MDKSTIAQDRFQMMLEILAAREAELDKKMAELRAIEKRIKQMSVAFLKVVNNPRFPAIARAAISENIFEEER